MIRAIIIDDEPNCIAALVQELKICCADILVADTCTSGKEGILSIRNHSPDLVFLDVEMPWMNGFEMLDIIGNNIISFQTIFTTAYSEFAARAFRVSAVDYLLKPIDGTDLTEAVAKVGKIMSLGKTSPNIVNLLDNARQTADHQKIAIHTKDGYDFIPLEKILYCKAEGPYTHVILSDKKLVLSKPLGDTEELLPESMFERIHHSLLVNLKHISRVRKTDGASVVMDNGEELPVSKSKKESLLARMGINKNI